MAVFIEKEGTTSTPYVLIDEEKSYMRLEGRSFHEDVAKFFRDVSNWLDSYLETDFGVFTFDCEMNYFNTSTIKLLLNMLMKMDRYASAEKRIVVNWITTASNDIVIECGEDFHEEIKNIEFNMIIK